MVDGGASELEADICCRSSGWPGAPIGMTAHILYPRLGRGALRHPVADVIDEVIRSRIGFDGLLLSDDIAMEALSGPVADAGGGARGRLRPRAALLRRPRGGGGAGRRTAADRAIRGRPARAGDGAAGAREWAAARCVDRQARRFAHLAGVRLVRAGGLEPPQALRPYGFSYQLRLSPPPGCGAFVVWTIPSPCAGVPALGAARLVSTPSRFRGLGSGSPCDRFPRI